jgi:hypothetical protein
LRHVARGHARHVAAVEQDRTGIGLDETADAADQRRFAGPVRADHGAELLRFDAEAHTLEDLAPGAAVAGALISNLKNSHCRLARATINGFVGAAQLRAGIDELSKIRIGSDIVDDSRRGSREHSEPRAPGCEDRFAISHQSVAPVADPRAVDFNRRFGVSVQA